MRKQKEIIDLEIGKDGLAICSYDTYEFLQMNDQFQVYFGDFQKQDFFSFLGIQEPERIKKGLEKRGRFKYLISSSSKLVSQLSIELNFNYKNINSKKHIIITASDASYKDEMESLVRSIKATLAIKNVELKKSIAKAEKLAKIKSEFLANMSHEIRTPMNGVIGVIELLRGTQLNSSQGELVRTMEACGKGLLSVVNDILDYNKLEAGKMLFEKGPFHLRRLIKNTIFLFESEASKKGNTLNYSLSKTGIHYFEGDEVRVGQILTNIVSNALKFTNNGSVWIFVEINLISGDLYDLHFSIKDTGIGIPQNKQEKIFESFTQADVSTTRKYGGTGLGLTISHSLCEQMGGQMWLESEEGVGSTFHFTLKMKQTLPEETNLNSSFQIFENNSVKNVSMNILLVEDNEINQVIISKLLERIGYNCDIVENGKLSLDALEKQDYDLVFMDMQMPIMDGVKATKEIIKKWGKSRPRIVALTANVLSEDKKRCFDAGMDDFVGKPVTIKSLLSAFSNHINSNHKNLLPSSQCSKNQKQKKEITNRKKVSVLYIDDNQHDQELIAHILKGDQWKLKVATSREDGLKKLSNTKPCIILVGSNKANMDDIEFIAKVRKRKKYNKTPLYLCTKKKLGVRIKKKLDDLGANYFLKNPYKDDNLSMILTKHFIESPNLKILNIEKIITEYEDLLEVFKDMVIKFRKEYANVSEEIIKHISDNNAKGVQESAHSLKGSLALLYAEVAKDSAFRLQKISETGDMVQATQQYEILENHIQKLIPELEKFVRIRAA